MKTAKELELSLLLKESHIQQLNLKVDNLNSIIDKQQEQINKYLDAVSTLDAYIKGNEDAIGLVINLDYLSRTLKGDDKE